MLKARAAAQVITPLLPFARLTGWQWKIGQLNPRWHFPQKPVQLPQPCPDYDVLLLLLARCLPHLMTISPPPTSPLTSQCRCWCCCGWCNAGQCRAWNIVSTMPPWQCPPSSQAPTLLNWLQPKSGSMSRDATSTSSPAFFQLRFWNQLFDSDLKLFSKIQGVFFTGTHPKNSTKKLI